MIFEIKNERIIHMSKKICFPICTAILGLLCLNTEAQGPKMPPTAVLVEKVQEVTHAAEKKYVGMVRAKWSINLPARVSGILLDQKFKEGEFVKKGQLMFQIEDTTYLAKEKAAEATVKQCQAELDFAQDDFNRQSGLYAKKAVAQTVYLEAKRRFHSAQAALAQAEANLMDAKNTLSYTKIYAPIDGIASKAPYCPGNYVTPSSEPLADVVSYDPIYVRFAISERDFSQLFGSVKKLKEKGSVRIQMLNGNLFTHKGAISLVNNKFDSETGTILVWALFENPDHELVPGTYATVLLSRKLEKPLNAVKLSAVMTDGKNNYVYTVDEKNTVAKRVVKAGEVSGNLQFVEGVNKGETVIVDGTHKTMPGATIIPMTPEEAVKKGFL